MADLGPRSEISFAQTFLCSAFAACFAEVCIILCFFSFFPSTLMFQSMVVDFVAFTLYLGIFAYLGQCSSVPKVLCFLNSARIRKLNLVLNFVCDG